MKEEFGQEFFCIAGAPQDAPKGAITMNATHGCCVCFDENKCNNQVTTSIDT